MKKVLMILITGGLLVGCLWALSANIKKASGVKDIIIYQEFEIKHPVVKKEIDVKIDKRANELFEQANAKGMAIGDVKKDEIIVYTNNRRNVNGAKQLKESTNLNKVALMRADEIRRTGKYEHNMDNHVSYTKTICDNTRLVGENLAINYTSSSSVIEGWMNSPGHRDNLLSDEYNEIGIGISTAPWQRGDAIVIVQVLGQVAK